MTVAARRRASRGNPSNGTSSSGRVTMNTVPEVDAGSVPLPSAAGADPEGALCERVRVDDGHDRSRRRKPDQREPAPVEEGLELTEVETEPDEAPGGEANDVEKEWAVHPQRGAEPSPTGKLLAAHPKDGT